MSHFTTVDVKFMDIEAIKDALTEIGITNYQEADGNMVLMHDYDGRGTKATIKVSKKTLGGGSDLGFVQQEDGSYKLLLDDWSAARSILKSKCKPGQTSPQMFKQAYAKSKVVREAQKRGYHSSSTKAQADGSMQVVLSRWV